MTVASLGIDDDDWPSEIAREVEGRFAIKLPDEALAHVTTVGELYDLIIRQGAYPGDEEGETSVALDALRRALGQYGVPQDARPGLQLGDLGLPRLKAVRAALQDATGLTLPGLPLSWVGSLGMVVATFLPFFAWRFGYGWWGAPGILLGVVLVRSDPGAWSGEWKTLGGLARATAALNHYVLAARGAQHAPAASWRTLTALLSGRAAVPAAEIGPETRLLA